MRKIEAFVSPDAVERVQAALLSCGLSEFIMSEVTMQDFGGLFMRNHEGRAYPAESHPEVKLELVVPESRAQSTMYAILDACRGRRGPCTARVLSLQVNEIISDLPRAVTVQLPASSRIAKELKA